MRSEEERKYYLTKRLARSDVRNAELLSALTGGEYFSMKVKLLSLSLAMDFMWDMLSGETLGTAAQGRDCDLTLVAGELLYERGERDPRGHEDGGLDDGMRRVEATLYQHGG